MLNALIDAVKGFMPKMIALIVAMLVGRLGYEVLINTAGFDPMGLVHTLAVTVVASLFTLLTVTALDNAK